MPRSLLIPVVLGFAFAVPLPAARAQEPASPQALNDCTALTDPAALQQCIVTGQGARKIRGRLSSHRAPPPDTPIYKDAETPEKTLNPLGAAP